MTLTMALWCVAAFGVAIVAGFIDGGR